MLHYLLDYGAFLLGASLHILGKMQKFKELAESNPDPNVVFSYKVMFSKEWINIARLLIGGIGLILFMPTLIGGATVDIKNTEGAVIANLAIQTILAPSYFLVAIAGNSALFGFFGKYEKTLLNRVGV